MKAYGNETKMNFSYAFVRLLSKKPVEDITVTDICNEAHYSRETFYYHFKDKYDLINKVYYAQLKWHMREYYGNEDFYITISRLMKGIKNMADFYIKGFQDYRYEGLENAMINYSEITYSEMVKHSTNSTELNLEMKSIIRFNAAGTIDLIKYWLTHNKDFSHRQFGRLLVDSLSPELSEIFLNYSRQKIST